MNAAGRFALWRHRQHGASMLETLMALPILCLLGLGAIQFGLLMQARQALSFALLEAARSGSADHADPATVRSGLARGLMPWLFGASNLSDYTQNLAHSSIELARTEAAGRLVLTQLSPHAASFEDWGEPGRGLSGERLASVTEIPNDNLSVRSTRMQPASGVSGFRGAEPIGQRSRQTLADANLLSLQLDYAVPLKVPVFGRMLAATLRAWAGCQPVGPSIGFGPLNLAVAAPAGSQASASGGTQVSLVAGHACTMYGDPGTGASVAQDPAPSLPVRVTVTVRMQSAARQSLAVSGSDGAARAGQASTASSSASSSFQGVVDAGLVNSAAPISTVSPWSGSTLTARPPESGASAPSAAANPTSDLAGPDLQGRAAPVSTNPDPAVCDALGAS